MDLEKAEEQVIDFPRRRSIGGKEWTIRRTGIATQDYTISLFLCAIPPSRPSAFSYVLSSLVVTHFGLDLDFLSVANIDIASLESFLPPIEGVRRYSLLSSWAICWL